MNVLDTSEADEWDVTSDSEAKTALFREVGDSMRAAARGGIRTVIVGQDPDEHDVEDVVVQAFHELWRKDRSEVESVVGLARSIAKRRGIDRGRRLSRENKRDQEMRYDLDRVDLADDLTEIEHAAIQVTVQQCKAEDLNDDQRAVIAETMEGIDESRVSLREYADACGKTYEACRTMRIRALKKLTACVHRLLGLGGTDE